MSKKLLFTGMIFSLGFLMGWLVTSTPATVQGNAQTKETQKLSKEEESVRNTLTAFTEACNRHDLKAIGEFWATDSEFTDDDGVVTKGRDAILKAYENLFAENKNIKFSISATSIRVVKGEFAIQDGTLEITQADGSIDKSRVSIVWVKSGDRWQIQSAKDLPYIEPETGTNNLKELEWMIGEWTNDKETLDLKVGQMLDKQFLSLSYTVKQGDTELKVFELIGYDALTGQLKSWNFDSRSGYGEGLWMREGNSWYVEIAGVLGSGQTGSGTNIIRFKDNNTFQFQSTEREVDGVPVPNNETTIIRKGKK
jgi:uncharacterized protein (TIGR02246 family)